MPVNAKILVNSSPNSSIMMMLYFSFFVFELSCGLQGFSS